MRINFANMWDTPEPTEPAEQIHPWPRAVAMSEEDKHLFLQRLAQKIGERHLQAVAFIFFSSLAPVKFIGSQALLFLRPLLSTIVKTADLQALFCLLEEEGRLEELLELLEGPDAPASIPPESTNP